jgi:hypothetical protein
MQQEILYRLNPNSSNRKLGKNFASTYTSRNSCPDTCKLKGNGCYGDNFPLVKWWDSCELPLQKLTYELGRLPKGSNLRINVAGDIPSPTEITAYNAVIKKRRLNVLCYTHRPPEFFTVKAEFTLNFSTENITRAVELHNEGYAVVVVLPSTLPFAKVRKWAGVPIVTCPAEYRDETTCSNCMMCAIPERKFIVGFTAHGSRKALVNEVTL